MSTTSSRSFGATRATGATTPKHGQLAHPMGRMRSRRGNTTTTSFGSASRRLRNRSLSRVQLQKATRRPRRGPFVLVATRADGDHYEYKKRGHLREPSRTAGAMVRRLAGRNGSRRTGRLDAQTPRPSLPCPGEIRRDARPPIFDATPSDGATNAHTRSRHHHDSARARTFFKHYHARPRRHSGQCNRRDAGG